MSTELIKAVFVRHDGVYLYSKSNNDDFPFREWKCESLTDVYKSEGQRGLDREIVRMLCEYAKIESNHPSLERYKPCMLANGRIRLYLDIFLENEFEKLSPEDINTLWLPEEQRTDAVKEYRALKRHEEKMYYTQLAQYVTPLHECGRNTAR
jgi:hypothetical protein